MHLTWLGQAGLLFDFDGVRVMVDPYLSDSVAKVEPHHARRVPVDERFFDIRPDILLLTHDHLDHTDPETLTRFFEKYEGICVLASENAWRHVRSLGGRNNNEILFDRGTVVTERGIRFEAVAAEHSDAAAVGALITYGGDTFYVTGDTLYNKRIFADVTIRPKALFLPINGVGNNMNMTDAAAFASRIGAEYTVPVHFGLFDSLDERAFCVPGCVIPEIYQEIVLK